MTVNNNFMMAQQLYANKEGQSKHGLSDNSADQGVNPVASFSDIAQQMLSLLDTDKSGSIDKSEFSQAALALSKSSGKTDTTGDVTASNVLEQAQSTQPSPLMNGIQKNLLTKIMAAYNTPATLIGSTTNISA